MANTTISITLYRRHGRKEGETCPHSNDRYSPRCGCPIWMQFQYPKHLALFKVDGHKLRHGQNLWPLGTRSWSEAQGTAKDRQEKIESGVPTGEFDALTIKDATDKWLQVREQDGRDNDKANALVKRLLGWCEQEGNRSLKAITTAKIMEFRLSLPYRSGDSSSLKVHWSVLGGFFNWAVGMGYIEKSPIPNARQNPQFAIRFDKPEVEVPSRDYVDNVLAAATGPTKLMMLVQRWTGCAFVDAFNLHKDDLNDDLIRRRRTKTGERYRIRIPKDVADTLSTLQGKDGYFFHDNKYEWYYAEYGKTFTKAGVPNFHSHLFRHFRISELLSAGVSVDDVSLMVGASPQEIRKTYQHYIKEQEDRLDQIQEQEFKKLGVEKKKGSENRVQ